MAGATASLEAAALPFITVSDAGKFTVHEEACAYLSTLKGKVAVVSIAGLYRTGKSFLLNLLAGRDATFRVGPTVQACTKGIWLWGKAMPLEDGTEDDFTHVVFLDTEGLASTQRSESYDARVFALALLLSSYFIYNSTGTIDGNAVSKLSLVVNLTKHVHVKATAGDEDPGTSYAEVFPHFLWVVRDFTVKLEREGRRISSRDYLEEALRPEDGMGEAVDQKNAIRHLLRSFFPERDCVTMVRPVSEEADLMDLSKVPFDKLRPGFQSQVEALRRRVWSTVRPKTLYGKVVNGSMLGDLAVAYCDAINANQAPTISTAWERVVDRQCEAAVEAAVTQYLAAMDAAGGGVLEADALYRLHDDSTAAALAMFRQEAVQDDVKVPAYEAALLERLRDELAKRRKSNTTASQAMCEATSQDLVAEAAAALTAAVEGMADGTAMDGIVRAYNRAVAEFVASYSDAAKGPAKWQVLADALAKALPPLLVECSETAASHVKSATAKTEAQIAELKHQVVLAEGRAKTEEERRQQDKRAADKAIADQAAISAKDVEYWRGLAESRQSDLERLGGKQDSLVAAFEREANRYDDRVGELVRELSAARTSLEDVTSKTMGEMGKAAGALSDLAAARGRVAELEAELGDMKASMARRDAVSGSSETTIASLRGELQAMKEQTELLYESISVQKDLLKAKIAEKEECEYQWGASKAQLADSEGQKIALESELNTTEAVLRKCREVLLKNKRVLSGAGFDAVEERKFYSC